MPVRVKGLHYINVPHFFEYIFAIIKPFLTEKMRNRVSFSSHVLTNKNRLVSLRMAVFMIYLDQLLPHVN